MIERSAQHLLDAFPVPGAQRLDQLVQAQAPRFSEAVDGVVVQHRQLEAVNTAVKLVVDAIVMDHHARPRELEERAARQDVCDPGELARLFDPQSLPVPDQIAIEAPNLDLVERTEPRIEGPQRPRHGTDLLEEEVPHLDRTGVVFRQTIVVEHRPDVRLVVDLLDELREQPDLRARRAR